MERQPEYPPEFDMEAHCVRCGAEIPEEGDVEFPTEYDPAGDAIMYETPDWWPDHCSEACSKLAPGKTPSGDVAIERKCPREGCPETKAYHLRTRIVGVEVYCPAGHSCFLSREERMSDKFRNWLRAV